MKDLLPAIDKEILKKELNQKRFIKNTRKGGNEIYIINGNNSPNTMNEIGRLREKTFRLAGGGTGESIDVDAADFGEHCYEQLIVWSPEDEEIIGGYRFICCEKAIDKENNKIHLSTANYFNFSDNFINQYLPHTIELGRSWIQPNFQGTNNARKGLFALDNIWDGLGALIQLNPKHLYFFGKVTMYPSYKVECRDFLLHFMHSYFPDTQKLMHPHNPIPQKYNKMLFDEELKGLSFTEGIKKLNTYIRERGEFIPPLVNIYMNLSPSMKTFGTALNSEFGNVEETGIMVTIKDIYPEKKERHMS